MELRTPAAVTTLLFAALSFCLPLAAQEQPGPLPLPPPQQEYPPAPPPASRPPAQPAPAKPAAPEHASSGISKAPPTVPPEEIIKKFAASEAEFRQELGYFTYSQTFTFQTIDDSGQPDGEYRMDSDISYPSGKRNETVTYAPQPTLERVEMTQQDLNDLEKIEPFALTPDEVPKYNITYAGREQVDELGAYVFDVAPKLIEKGQRYFQGRIWVDEKDLAIIKTDGKAVPDIHKKNEENLFPRFETYRENIEGHYWFPTYTHSDDTLHFKSGDIHIRVTIHYFDYKRFRSTIRLLKSTPVETPQK